MGSTPSTPSDGNGSAPQPSGSDTGATSGVIGALFGFYGEGEGGETPPADAHSLSPSSSDPANPGQTVQQNPAPDLPGGGDDDDGNDLGVLDGPLVTPTEFVTAARHMLYNTLLRGLSQGIDVNVTANIPRVPQGTALWCGLRHREIVELLLAQPGIDVHREVLGEPPIYQAANNGLVHTTRLLLEAGADPDAVFQAGHTCVLGGACFNGSVEIVKLLLEYGANLDGSIEGRSPMDLLMSRINGKGSMAGSEAHLEIKALLEAEADARNSVPMARYFAVMRELTDHDWLT